MKKPLQLTLIWTPRVLSILFALFVSIFALDVFGEGKGFWGTVVALLVHLIPTAIILLVLAFSWNHGWVGAIFFPALGVWYLLTMWGRFPWSTYLVIAGPLFLMGVLFLGDWICRAKLRRAESIL